MLFHRTNQARRGLHKRPDRRSHRRVGTCHNALLRGVKPQARREVCLRTCPGSGRAKTAEAARSLDPPGATRACQPRSAEPLVGEDERIVGKLNGRQFLRVDHHLERFNPLTYRGGNRRIGGRGRPYSDQSALNAAPGQRQMCES